MDSHAEVRATHRRNGLRWSAHFDLRGSLAPKDVQEEFARRTAEAAGAPSTAAAIATSGRSSRLGAVTPAVLSRRGGEDGLTRLGMCTNV
jgi:hypothetical protein